MAPQVRDLQALIAEQSKAVAPQQQLLDESIGANDNSGQAQVQGLDVAKNQAFKTIDQNAQNKGMFFSGVSPDEQSQYTGATYLPALAQLQATIAATRASLLGKKADLNTDVFKTATGLRENDISAKAAYDRQQQEQAFADAQAEKDRQFKATQAAADRQAAASASSSKAPSSAAVKQNAVQTLAGALAGVVGKDGYVSPGSYSAAKNEWVNAGYSSKEFDNTFGNRRNPNNHNYSLG